jgi:excisionase family DNA binding protein
MPKKKKITPLTPRLRGVITLPEAAVYLGIGEGTLRNWVSMKRVAYVKVGSKTHFRLADLDAYLDAHRVAAVGQ